MENQADISRNQSRFSMDSEGPLVVVGGITYPASEPTRAPGEPFIIHLKNGGRGVGIIDEVLAIPTYHVSGHALPARPDYFTEPISRLIAPPLFPGESSTITVTGGDEIRIVPGFATPPHISPDERLARTRSGALPFDIYGFVKYKSTSEADNRLRISGYCFHYVPLVQRVDRQFTVCDNPNYTYVH